MLVISDRTEEKSSLLWCVVADRVLFKSLIQFAKLYWFSFAKYRGYRFSLDSPGLLFSCVLLTDNSEKLFSDTCMHVIQATPNVHGTPRHCDKPQI